MPGAQDGLGRVTYVHNGECFFLPYGLDDVLGTSTTPKAGDDVLFQIATDKRSYSRKLIKHFFFLTK